MRKTVVQAPLTLPLMCEVCENRFCMCVCVCVCVLLEPTIFSGCFDRCIKSADPNVPCHF